MRTGCIVFRVGERKCKLQANRHCQTSKSNWCKANVISFSVLQRIEKEQQNAHSERNLQKMCLACLCIIQPKTVICNISLRQWVFYFRRWPIRPFTFHIVNVKSKKGGKNLWKALTNPTIQNTSTNKSMKASVISNRAHPTGGLLKWTLFGIALLKYNQKF